MGAGVSVHRDDDDDDGGGAVFRELRKVYDERVALRRSDDGDEAEYHYMKAAYFHFQALSEEQRRVVGPHPALVEWEGLNDDERGEREADVLERAKRQDKKYGKAAPTAASQDYSKGFSGSAEDTKNEAEAAAILRGDGGSNDEDEATDPNALVEVDCDAQQLEALRAAGRWMRFLGVSGCYMYVHSVLKTVVAARPDDFADDAEEAVEEEEVDPANGLDSCEIADLLSKVEEIVASKKTPLLLDSSDEGKVAAFFSYHGIVMDVKVLAIGYAKSGVKVQDVMETCRQKTVGALKSGQTLVLDLGHSTPVFKGKLCKREVFPVEIFQEAGQKVFAPRINPRYEKLFREEDKEEGQCAIKCPEKFRFLVTSKLSPFEFEEKLSGCLPMGYLVPVYVKF